MIITGFPESGMTLLRGLCHQHPGMAVMEDVTSFRRPHVPYAVRAYSVHGDGERRRRDYFYGENTIAPNDAKRCALPGVRRRFGQRANEPCFMQPRFYTRGPFTGHSDDSREMNCASLTVGPPQQPGRMGLLDEWNI